jgi:hypothetical protein
VVGRHAYGDIYRATELRAPGKGKVTAVSPTMNFHAVAPGTPGLARVRPERTRPARVVQDGST